MYVTGDPVANQVQIDQIAHDLEYMHGLMRDEAHLLANIAGADSSAARGPALLNNAIANGTIAQISGLPAGQMRGDRLGALMARMARQDSGLDFAGAIGAGRAETRGGVPGGIYAVPFVNEIGQTQTIEAWHPQANQPQGYNCHAVPTGGDNTPHGSFSPLGEESPTGQGNMSVLLDEQYQPVPIPDARPGDLVVWRSRDEDEVQMSSIEHSVVITHLPDQLHDSFDVDQTRVQTQNGTYVLINRQPQLVPERNMTLRQVSEGLPGILDLIDAYGDADNVVYRRKGT